MATNMKDVLAKKRAQKSILTKLKTKLSEPDLSVSDLELLKTKFNNIQNEFDTIFDSIINLSTEENVEKLSNEQDEINSSLIDIEFEINDRLSRIAKENKFANTTVISENSVVRLPKISLPSFAGEMHSWLSFKDIFKASIDQNPNLSDAIKLQYLKSALKGDAFRIIQTISITDSNYQLAWSLLEERYSNTRGQIYAQLKRFMSIPVIQNESTSVILNLIDVTSEVVRSLESLEQKLDGFSSTIFAFILSQKLDQNTKLWWERNLKKETLPTISELLDFLKDYARTLSATRVPVMPKRNPPKVSSMVSCVTEKHVYICKLCNAEHKLFKCPKFQKFDVKDRVEYVRKQNLCFCCFGTHAVRNCSSNYLCRVCKKKHNSLLCYEREKGSFSQNKMNCEIASPSEQRSDASQSANYQELDVHAEPFVNKNENKCFLTAANANENCNRIKRVLLSTAVIFIKGKEGKIFPARTLLDNGSMIHLCSSELAEKLRLQKENVNLSVGCLSGISTTVKSKVSAVIFNREKTYSRELDFFVIPKITHLMPSRQIDVCNIVIPERVKLADPDFHKPGKIQLLLGSEIFFDLIRSGQIYVPNTNLVLQNSAFGYLVSGSIEDSLSEKQLVHCGLIYENAETQLKKFFDLESIGIIDDPNSYDEDKALEIFNKTVSFKEDRYVVSLPWKKSWEQLGDNFVVAKKRIKSLSRKMQHDNTLYLKYREILNEYLDQGIIERVSDTTKPVNKPVFYLPHQAVYREESITTKMRIVFDASSHEIGHLSLNDCLWPGINLNPNIFHLLVYFRLNRVAILGDVEKAFLQIALAEKDRDAVRFLFVEENGTPFQKIDDQLEVYRFKRVLFGVNSSPFLLAATIKLHSQKFRDVYPDAFQILDTCMYVDDFVAGADNVSEALKISSEAKEIMSRASMNLRKWVTNDKCLVKKWEEERFDIHPLSSNEKTLKVLGIQWNIQEDSLSVDTSCLTEPLKKKKNTKRFILQTAGKIYDPLGLITPFTVRLKFLLQKLWLRKLPWDAELPSDLNDEWSQWCSEFSQLSNIKVPRFVLDSCDGNIEIHVFSDASQKSYGAAAYVRVQNQEQISVNLITSKSRVSPVKKVSLPRLELLGALIAARLGTEVKKVLDRKGSPNIFFWSDSKVTLYWIKGSSRRWKSFVQNRVNEIQKLTNPDSWFYCSTKVNPADLLTRGVSAASLVNNSKWWTCADFLIEPHLPFKCLQPMVPEVEYLTPGERESYMHERKSSIDINDSSDTERTMLIHENSNVLDELLNISNNYYKTVNVLSYIFRFVYNCRNKCKIVGPLKLEEVRAAEEKIIRYEQRAISCKKGVTGNLKNLHPFVDRKGIIRVGGRLGKASLPFSQKYPAILPRNSKLSKIYFCSIHKRLLHVGPQGLLNAVRLKFWPLGGRDLARKTVHLCVTCFKCKPILSSQIMGNLPYERVNRAPPFSVTGLDLCGPFSVTYKNQRKGVLNKIYVCVCICFVTRAIHLEPLSDLTSNALVATLKRFMARRGKCAKIFTDNAPNFVGANSQLKKFYNTVNFPDKNLASYFTSEGIDWNFIPPRSPHFGGLWEAGVKSVKHHLKRTIGNLRFTYEEFETIIVQVEGILNSRPLTPISNDFDDYEVLTPGHFLVGRSINAIPEPMIIDVNENRLSRWQKMTKVIQIIWKKWTTDYLGTLQQRTKWLVEKNNISVGSMVLVKEDYLPVCKWFLGRVVEVYHGSDNKVRTVKIKTKSGEFKRAITKIAVLPIEN